MKPFCDTLIKGEGLYGTLGREDGNIPSGQVHRRKEETASIPLLPSDCKRRAPKERRRSAPDRAGVVFLFTLLLRCMLGRVLVRYALATRGEH